MGYFTVRELNIKDQILFEVKKFIFSMIKNEYGYGYVPEYHYDINDMESYYLKPRKNNFLIAKNTDSSNLIGTIGIRAYDKDFDFFNGIYDSDNTASIWRVFVDKPWRRNGVASSLVSQSEDFCRKNGYEKIYLHTHKTVNGSLDFWLSNGYEITKDTGNHLKTVHMEKIL